MKLKTGMINKIAAVFLSVLTCVGLIGFVPNVAKGAPEPSVWGEVKTKTWENVNFINGGFEEPDMFKVAGMFTVDYAKANKYNMYNHTAVPGWTTRAVNTAHDGFANSKFIEMERSGFTEGARVFNAHNGVQFAELNAVYPGTLYQICKTTPGQRVYYEFYHRGRKGNDTMNFYMYNATLGEPNPNYNRPNPTTALRTCTDGNTAWGRYKGVYTVPAGQENTIFAFQSVSAAGGDNSIGNYLDDIRLFFPSFLDVQQTIKTAEKQGNDKFGLLGEMVTLQFKVKNSGDTTSSKTVLTDVLPDGLLYLPGTAKINGTDANGLVSFDPASDKLTVRLGEEATSTAGGRIQKGAEWIVEVQAMVTGQNRSLGDLVRNQAKITYNDYGFEEDNPTDYVNHSNVDGFIIKEREVGGKIWLDSNFNSTIDSGEPNFDGITVKMVDPVTHQTLKNVNGADLITQTDANGNYQFIAFPARQYVIVAGPVGTLGNYKVGDTGVVRDNWGRENTSQYPENIVEIWHEKKRELEVTSFSVGAPHSFKLQTFHAGFSQQYKASKDSVVNGVLNNGTRTAPAPLEYGDIIEYTFTFNNKAEKPEHVINHYLEFRDALPEGLEYVRGEPEATVTIENGRQVLNWKNPAPIPQGITMFKAWVRVKNPTKVFENWGAFGIGPSYSATTNYTYHEVRSVSLDIVQKLGQASAEEESFVFEIDYRETSGGPIKHTFYGVIKIPAGQTTGVAQFKKIKLGHYSVRLADSSWRYELDASTPREQAKNINITEQHETFNFLSNRESEQWLSGKASEKNVMEPV